MEPVGIAEIAERLGLSPKTASQWNQRGVLPDPKWTVSGAPAWDWEEIKLWAVETGRKLGYLYVEYGGRRHGLIATDDPVTGTVWVPVWLVDQEQPLQWIRDVLKLRSTGWFGSYGPLVYKVLRPAWEDHMQQPDPLGRPFVKEPLGKFTRF